MTDLLITSPEAFSDGKPLVERYKDMGDGSFAEVEVSYTATEVANGIIGNTPFTAVVGPITTTTSTALKAAGGAGVKNKLTSYTVVNTSATASAFNILSGATVIWTDYIGATSSKTVTLPTPLVTAANTALNVQMATTATSTTVSVTGLQGA